MSYQQIGLSPIIDWDIENKEAHQKRISEFLNGWEKALLYAPIDPLQKEINDFLARDWSLVKVGKPYWRKRYKVYAEKEKQLQNALPRRITTTTGFYNYTMSTA